MVAGTSNWNVDSEPSKFTPFQEHSCFLASLIAARVAQWTEDERSNGGSPTAAVTTTITFNYIFLKGINYGVYKDDFYLLKKEHVFYVACCLLFEH